MQACDLNPGDLVMVDVRDRDSLKFLMGMPSDTRTARAYYLEPSLPVEVMAPKARVRYVDYPEYEDEELNGPSLDYHTVDFSQIIAVEWVASAAPPLRNDPRPWWNEHPKKAPAAWVAQKSEAEPTTFGDHDYLSVDAKTGAKKGVKAEQLGALDPLSLMEVAKVAGMGSGKYGRFNWAAGMDYSLLYDAAQRHLMKWQSGETNDDESGLNHLAHATFHLLALMSYQRRGVGQDDRFGKVVDDDEEA